MNSSALRRSTCLLTLVGLVATACDQPQSTDPHREAGPSAATARGADITEARARQLALEAVPGGEIDEAELETEDGIRIYSVDVVRDGIEYEVHLDPATGAVLRVGEEIEDGDHADSDGRDGADDDGDDDGDDDDGAGDVSTGHSK